MLGNWFSDTLRLFEVIASPILLFGPDGQLSCYHCPHAYPQRSAVQAKAQQLAAAWPESIGAPVVLDTVEAMGGMRLPDQSVVIVGPIAPLKVTIAGQHHELANTTALKAANWWLTQISAECRRLEHEPAPHDVAHALEGALDSALDSTPMVAPESGPRLQVTELEQELGQLLGLKLSAEPEPPHAPEGTLCTLLERNYDLSAIWAAQGMAYNPLDGNCNAQVLDPKDADDFIEALHLGKISTVHHHNQLRNEVLMQEAIREGNLDKMRWVSTVPTKGQAGILGFTPLRHWQNHAHLNNVLASRAAIEAGIAPEQAYVLSDKLFLVVEQVQDPLLAKQMRLVIWRAFTEQVKRHHDELKARQQTMAALTPPLLPSARPEPVLVLKARYLMAQRLMEPLTLTQIAAELDCTPEHLARSFKRYHHQTVHDYLVAERIKLAKELLLESNHKIGEIAQLLQFASSSHLGAAFKAREHISPRQWRQLHAKVYEG